MVVSEHLQKGEGLLCNGSVNSLTVIFLSINITKISMVGSQFITLLNFTCA
jgi:hypothetical protein